MKYIKQFRYYGTESAQTYPIGLTYGQLRNGNIFKDCGTVTHLGIQAAPGTTFYLNNSPASIVVGSTGIYELNLEGLGHITAIRFDKESLDKITDDTDGILIDIVYEGSGVSV